MNKPHYAAVRDEAMYLTREHGSAKQALFEHRKDQPTENNLFWDLVEEHLGMQVCIENLRADNAEMAEALGVSYDPEAK